MTAEFDGLARSANRRTYVYLGVLVATSLPLFAAAVYGSVVQFFAVGALWAGVLYAPLVTVRERKTLTTAQSQAEIVADFTGPDLPVMALQRSRADSVEPSENGAVCSVARFGCETTFSYEGHERDGDIVVEISVGGDRESRTAVTVEATDGGHTNCVLTGRRRLSVAALLASFVQGSLEERALARMGYETVETERTYGVGRRRDAERVEAE